MHTMTEMSTAFVLSGYSEDMVSQQSSPGILVFSRSLKLQYVNRRALELIRTIDCGMTESSSIVFPAPILAFGAEVQDCLDDRLKVNLWEPFEMSQVVSGYGHRILLRGFGYSNAEANRNSRIVIVLEEIRSLEKNVSQQLHVRMSATKTQRMGAV
jgi:hypothetical protein